MSGKPRSIEALKSIEMGKIYGRLTVIDVFTGRRSDKEPNYTACYYTLRCTCGKVITRRKSVITSGSDPTRSCGCLFIDTNREKIKSLFITHGQTIGKRTRIYRSWGAMLERCTNPKNKAFPNYGGRGIAVCEKWLTFSGFFEDMRGGYAEDLTLGRINNDGNYCKDNCRWETIKQQNNNNRKNWRINGVPLSEFCEQYGIKYWTGYARARNNDHRFFGNNITITQG